MFFCKLVPMIKLMAGAFTALCLLTACLFLAFSPTFPERLPSDAAGWASALFALFRQPVGAGVVLSLSVLLAAVAASVTELLLGLIFSVLSALLALVCLLCVLGARYPGFAESLLNFLS